MNFLMKAFLKSQMKGVPEDQINMILTVIEKNPDLFKKIGEEIQAKISAGAEQQAAATEVVMKYQKEIAEVMKQ